MKRPCEERKNYIKTIFVQDRTKFQLYSPAIICAYNIDLFFLIYLFFVVNKQLFVYILFLLDIHKMNNIHNIDDHTNYLKKNQKIAQLQSYLVEVVVQIGIQQRNNQLKLLEILLGACQETEKKVGGFSGGLFSGLTSFT